MEGGVRAALGGTRLVYKRKEKKKKLLISAAARSSPSLQPLVFWPRAVAFGAGAILELCAQLVWCELYDMKNWGGGIF